MINTATLGINCRLDLAKLIEHTALKPEATIHDITSLCREALDHQIFGVCIAPSWVGIAKDYLGSTRTRIVTVIGFPHGNTLSEVKAFEAEQAMGHGAHELDMVMNVGLLRSGDHRGVLRDIRAVVDVAHRTPGVVVKVIIETAVLSDEQKVSACKLVEDGGADFVKTSTGFASGGATKYDVELMKRTVGNSLGLKAAGGIRDLSTVLAMIGAGATRIGCSASLPILLEMPE